MGFLYLIDYIYIVYKKHMLNNFISFKDSIWFNSYKNTINNNYKIFYSYFISIPDVLIISWSLHMVICSIWIDFDPFYLGFQKVIELKFFDLYINFGIDGLSLFFIYLVSFFIAVMFSTYILFK